MEVIVPAVIFLMFVAIVGAMVHFVVRLVKQAEPRADAPVPLGFHERKRMDLREFYETYYLKPGSEIRMNEAQAGLTMFALAARVPAELLRPTDRIADFGGRGLNIVGTLLTARLQQAIAQNPKLEGSKLESVDDLIQFAVKAEAEGDVS